MFIISSYSTAVIFCIITMFCWGSWANTQKLAAASWRFELFYWDYVIGIVLLSFLFAFSLGSTGDGGRAFMEDWRQASEASIRSALIGGIIFNAANILLSAAIAVAGLSVAFPVGIGLALVIGVVGNYLQAPLGNAPLLFGGVFLHNKRLALLIPFGAMLLSDVALEMISGKTAVPRLFQSASPSAFAVYTAIDDANGPASLSHRISISGCEEASFNCRWTSAKTRHCSICSRMQRRMQHGNASTRCAKAIRSMMRRCRSGARMHRIST